MYNRYLSRIFCSLDVLYNIRCIAPRSERKTGASPRFEKAAAAHTSRYTHASKRALSLSHTHTQHTHTHSKHLSKRWTVRLEMIKSNSHCNRRHASNSRCNRHHTHVSKSCPRLPTKRRGFDLSTVTTSPFKAWACLSYSNKHAQRQAYVATSINTLAQLTLHETHELRRKERERHTQSAHKSASKAF